MTEPNRHATSFSVAAAGAMMMVNTVVLVRQDLGLSDEALALTLAAFGAGSMVAAPFMPPPARDRPAPGMADARDHERHLLRAAGRLPLAHAAEGLSADDDGLAACRTCSKIKIKKSFLIQFWILIIILIVFYATYFNLASKNTPNPTGS